MTAINIIAKPTINERSNGARIDRYGWQASHRENLIRQQLGQPIRTNYRSYQDANT